MKKVTLQYYTETGKAFPNIEELLGKRKTEDIYDELGDSAQLLLEHLDSIQDSVESFNLSIVADFTCVDTVDRSWNMVSHVIEFVVEGDVNDINSFIDSDDYDSLAIRQVGEMIPYDKVFQIYQKDKKAYEELATAIHLSFPVPYSFQTHQDYVYKLVRVRNGFEFIRRDKRNQGKDFEMVVFTIFDSKEYTPIHHSTVAVIDRVYTAFIRKEKIASIL